MSSSPFPLHSERVGRVRHLDNRDFAKLVWARIVRARDYHWLFKGSLQPYRGLGPEPEAPRIHDAEDFFLRRMRVREIGSAVLANREAPRFLLDARNVDVLLDLIEVLHAEVVSKPLMVHPPESTLIEDFDKEAGQAIFRDEMNEALALARPPLELLPNGQVVEIDEAHRDLYREPLPKGVAVKSAIADPVEHAIRVFVSRGSTHEDKRSAVKQLADALEHIRPQVKEELLRKDEGDLFRIANSFAIRHNGPDQQRDYAKEPWLDWIFHVYLATIRVVLALRDSQSSDTSTSAE
jgi:hypothetical protein